MEDYYPLLDELGLQSAKVFAMNGGGSRDTAMEWVNSLDLDFSE